MLDGVVRTLGDVRHVPDLNRNLILLSTIASKGYKYTGEGRVLRLAKGSTIIGDAAVATPSLSDGDVSRLWHMCLRHISENGMVELSRKGLLNGHSISKLKFYVAKGINSSIETSTSSEVANCDDSGRWMMAIQEEMNCKWVFKRKEEIPRVEEVIVKHSSIRALLGIVTIDFELEQLDLKTMFLHGELESFVHLFLYVDDMLIATKDKEEIRMVKVQLSKEFEMKDLGATKKILGMEILGNRKADKLYLSQKGYIEKVLHRFNMQNAKLVSTPLCSRVSHVCYGSRPDLSYVVSAISRYMTNPGQEHWKVVQWIFRYLRGSTDVYLHFGRTRDRVVGYVDSNFAGDLDKRRSLTSTHDNPTDMMTKTLLILVGLAKALFMDEISTGLDSSTTYQIVNSLRQTIHILNGTAVISLLKPPLETYKLFHDIIVLFESQIVYQGPRESMLEFF
ncbi:hypothetical protein AAG906_019919 [Vitis piasezkii]